MDEFSLIQHFFSSSHNKTHNNGVILGIGDDTAIIKVAKDEELLFTTDTLISGVHFPQGTDPAAIGHKSLAVNLSDIAAMGGYARWFTLALSLPEADPAWLNAFSAGLLKLAQQFDVSLVGGDTTRGPLSITISVIGTIPQGTAIRRSGARPGDAIYVSGHPGMAALGLAALEGRLALPEIEKSSFQNKLDYPQPRLEEGQFLRTCVSSMIDVSDGLAADLGHILDASACSAVIESVCLTDWLPASPSLTKETALDAALNGGDDYELLFSIATERIPQLEQNWRESFPPLQRIGQIAEGTGIVMQDSSGNIMNIDPRGYNHFHV